MNRGNLGGVVFLIGIGGLLANCGGDSFDGDGNGNGGDSGDGAGGSALSGGASGTAGTGSSKGGSGATGSGGRSSGGGGAMTGGAGGTPSGGAMMTGGAGATPSGGAMTGGTPSGGAMMTGGSAGAGGEPGFCLLPADAGACLAAMPRYFFNRTTGVCQPFTYGGCGGNENNFESIEECYGACGGQGEIDPAACQYPTDCALVPSACCGGCEQETLANMVAVKANKAAELSTAMGCDLVDCAICPRIPNPWLGATCRAGRCVAYDARQTELTECSTREDCRFRAELNCCEACNPPREAFIALNGDADVGPWVCGDWPGGCAGCVPIVPPNLSVICSNGRCGVLDAELPQ